MPSKETAVDNPYAVGKFNQAEFTIGTEAANSINVAVQLKDGVDNLGEQVVLDCYLSDDSGGAGVVAAVPDGDVAIGSNGAILGELVADKYFKVQTNATGAFDLDIGETAADTYYLVIVLPDGSLIVSDAITFAA